MAWKGRKERGDRENCVLGEKERLKSGVTPVLAHVLVPCTAKHCRLLQFVREL